MNTNAADGMHNQYSYASPAMRMELCILATEDYLYPN